MSSASASLRIVRNRGSTLPVSIRLTVKGCTPARAASSSWVNNARSRASLNCAPILTTSQYYQLLYCSIYVCRMYLKCST